MGIPSENDIEIPLVIELYLRGGEPSTSHKDKHGREIVETLAQYFELNEEDLNICTKEGRSRWKNALRFARKNLKNKGLLDGSDHGIWRLTSKGMDLVEKISKNSSIYERLLTLHETMPPVIESEFALLRVKCLKQATNIVLYGPPGTGKTYGVAKRVQDVLKESDDPLLNTLELDSQGNAKNLLEELAKKDRFEFVTFHQSYSYEDLIEGLRPVVENRQLRYKIEDGIFKQISRRAWRDLLWEEQTSSPSFDEIWAKTTARFQGDGEVRENWLIKTQDSDTISLDLQVSGASDPGTIEKSTVLEHWPSIQRINRDDKRERNSCAKNLSESRTEGAELLIDVMLDSSAELLGDEAGEVKLVRRADLAAAPQYFFIIDELNRGNVSKIFGELITLLEPSKRIGMEEQMLATLPLSKEPFGVPANLHVIATMNTTDRSIAALDVALRRRFRFEEVMPCKKVLEESLVEGDVKGKVIELFEVLNQRIEFLIDRDHTLGHAMFLDIEDYDDLSEVIQYNVIPLLQEYFYGEWDKISLVLGHSKDASHNVLEEKSLDREALFPGADSSMLEASRSRFEINPAFLEAEGEGLAGYIDQIIHPGVKKP